MGHLTTLLLLSTSLPSATSRYDPTWASLNTRPLPAWYDDAKIGIFIHFGVFSVPSFHGEWFWSDLVTAKDQDVVAFVNATEPPGFQYPDYAARLRPYFYNATQWAQLFAASGARYVVPTTKHHEGFCMWNSTSIGATFQWNIVDLWGRDVIGELVDAVRAANLTVGLYHSLFEFYNPLYLADKASGWKTNDFVVQKTLPELYDLVERYKPSLIWSDGDWEPDSSYWQATEFLAWLANDSPVADSVVWNDRWGGGPNSTLCHDGSFYTCADRFLPSTLVGHKWENAFTIDTVSWGYRRNALISDYMTVQQVISTVIQTVALGGNALINIGPAADGSIDPIFADRLLGLGAWLEVNGEGIYGTTPWRAQNSTANSVFYTLGKANGVVYAIFSSWGGTSAIGVEGVGGVSTLTLPEPIATLGSTTVTLLGYGGTNLTWAPMTVEGQPGMIVSLPNFAPDQAPCSYAWTVALRNVK